MRKYAAYFIVIYLLLSITGCSQKGRDAIISENETQPTNTIISDDSNPQTTVVSAEVSAEDTEELNRAYGEILWNVFYLGEIEGTAFADACADGNKSGGFVIYDIDGDGSKELLLYFDGGSMASNVEYIWGYKNGKTHVELDAYPLLSYYTNGIIEEGWSHNQGLAGDFWPYFVYTYKPDLDKYQMYGGVDAWDKTLALTNENDEKFPTQIDTDGDGIVYYILPVDWDGQYNMTPVDGKEYDNWKNNYLKNAKELTDITYQELSEKSIAELGAPKPDINYLEPQG